MMRICMLANARSVHTQRWATAFAERGHDVHIISIRTQEIPRVTVHTVAAFEANSESLLSTLLSYLLLLLRARWIIRRIEPDIVAPHYALTHGVIAAAAGAGPIATTTWGSDIVWNGRGEMPSWRRRALRFALGRAQVVFVTSRFMERSLVPLVSLGTAIRRVPFGVDTELFSPTRDGSYSDRLRIGFVKTLGTKYGPTDLIHAFALVHAEEPTTELVMAGRGPLREHCERLVNTLGLSDAVSMLGFVPNIEVPDLMRSLHVLVNCSVVDETFGVVVLEASSCEVPVVATNVGGVDETCVDGVNGILVPPGDVNALAQAILTLVRDDSLRARMGANGRQLVENQYRWSDSVTAVLAEYRRLVDVLGPTASDDSGRQ